MRELTGHETDSLRGISDAIVGAIIPISAAIAANAAIAAPGFKDTVKERLTSNGSAILPD